jgi:hypothetical protein
MMSGAPDSAMDLLVEAANALEGAAAACDDPEDEARFSELAHRIRTYLASSRSTTMLGMRQIPASESRLTDSMIKVQPSHIHIVPND